MRFRGLSEDAGANRAVPISSEALVRRRPLQRAPANGSARRPVLRSTCRNHERHGRTFTLATLVYHETLCLAIT